MCLCLPAKIDVVRSQIRIHQPLSDSKFSIIVFHAHKHDNEWHSHCNMSDDKRIQEYTNSGTERKREKEWGGDETVIQIANKLLIHVSVNDVVCVVLYSRHVCEPYSFIFYFIFFPSLSLLMALIQYMC